jgi:hypothetical protein
MKVELDIFSGRPNPSWELSPSEEAELARLLWGLKERTNPVAEDTLGLGYRGLVATDPTQEGLPLRLRAYPRAVGVILVQPDGSHTYYFTDTVGVERWLVQSARDHGYSDLIAVVLG